MIRFINSLVLILSVVFSASAVKLNQRGEKMVSEIRIEFESKDYDPYSVTFGYDKKGEINSILYDRYSEYSKERFVCKVHKDADGNIYRKDYYNGKPIDKYTFKVDSQKRPIEMVWYDKHEKYYTFNYMYDFMGFDLVITADKGYEDRKKCNLVKIEDGCVYTYYCSLDKNDENPTQPKRDCKILTYGEQNDDLNIDLFQIFSGYCHVQNGWDCLGSNLLFLAKWAPVRSEFLPTSVDRYNIEYVESDDNIVKVNLYSIYTKRLEYSIDIKYIE